MYGYGIIVIYKDTIYNQTQSSRIYYKTKIKRTKENVSQIRRVGDI